MERVIECLSDAALMHQRLYYKTNKEILQNVLPPPHFQLYILIYILLSNPQELSKI